MHPFSRFAAPRRSSLAAIALVVASVLAGSAAAVAALLPVL